MLPGHYQTACIPTVLQDTTGPAAYTLLPPSVWPANPRSSQSHAPHRSPPAHPASLPTPGDSAPAGWLGHSAPRSSVPPFQTLSPLPGDTCAPALRTTHAHTSRWETRLWSRSIHITPVPALPRLAWADDRWFEHLLRPWSSA